MAVRCTSSGGLLRTPLTQRRSLARALQKATLSPVGAVPVEICKYVLANNFGVTPSVTAYFVDVSGVKVPGSDIFSVPTDCSSGVVAPAILTGSAGIHVDVTFGPYTTILAESWWMP